MEHRFEELLSEAIQMYGRVYIKIPAGKRRLHRFPEAFEEQIRDLFPEEHSIHPVRRRMPLRMLITVIIAAILAVSATALTVGAFRDAIIGFITQVYETFTNVQAEADTSAPDTLAEIYEVTWLPEGFEQTEDTVSTFSHHTLFVDGTDYIHFLQYIPSKYSSNYDTENADAESFGVGDLEGFWISQDDGNVFVWKNEYYIFEIATSMELDETVKEQIVLMAESVEKVEN